MSIRRLISGTFLCPNCGEELLLTRVAEDEAICPSCGGELEEVDIDVDTEQDDEEE